MKLDAQFTEMELGKVLNSPSKALDHNQNSNHITFD